MNLISFTESHAKEVCNWEYKDEYSIYNYPKWNKVCDENWSITLQEKRETEFLALINDYNSLCGYIRLQDKKESVLMGVGLKPSLCGQGLGRTLIDMAKTHCNKLYPNKKIILEVRSFNERAIKCYTRLGFKVIEIYNKNKPVGYGEFIKMEFSH